MKNSVLTLSLCVLSSGLGYGAAYSSNFDDYTVFTPGADLAGKDGWTITGSTVGGASQIVSSPFPGGVRSAALGWQELDAGKTEVYLSHSLGSPLVGNTLSYSKFDATMLIQDSYLPYANRDAFAFTFKDDGGGNIFTLTFSPTVQAGDPDQLPLRVDNVSWSSDYGPTGPVNSGAIGTLTEFQYTTIDITFTQGAGTDVNFVIKSGDPNALVTLTNGTLSAAAAANINNFGALWTPTDSLNPGGNLLIFDNLSLIPEPSSALLGVLGASLVFVRRRRA